LKPFTFPSHLAFCRLASHVRQLVAFPLSPVCDFSPRRSKVNHQDMHTPTHTQQLKQSNETFHTAK